MPLDIVQIAAELLHTLVIEELSARVRETVQRSFDARRTATRRHSVRAARRIMHRLPTRATEKL
jgi:hypothetical protein